jgi:predicted metal-binding membrane protein
MLVLFAVGLMNLTAMVLLSAVIFAEKVLPRGAEIGRLAGVVLTGLGVFVLWPLLL